VSRENNGRIKTRAMKKLVYVIVEHDHKDNEHCNIGVTDELDMVEFMIKEYYGGKFKEVSFHDIRDSGIEYTKILEVTDHKGKPYRVTIILESFCLNEL
jgi:hypothetical protein